MTTIMKTAIITFIIIAFFTSPEANLDYSNLKHITQTKPTIVTTLMGPAAPVEEELEEYLVEDLYVETECQDCLHSAESSCTEIHSDCLDLPDCTDWLACVGWCEAYEGDDDCYFKCDESFVDNEMVEVDLRLCTCEMCGMECRALCGVEGY